MVKIRVEGLPAEVEAATEKLKKIYHILSESKQYKNRNSEYIRVYLDIEAVDQENK